MPVVPAPPAEEVVAVDVGWFIGQYSYAQVPQSDGGPLYPAELSQGYADEPALARGLAVSARAWPTPRFGIDLALQSTTYTESLGSTEDVARPAPERRAMERGSLSAVARRSLPLAGGTLSPEASVGAWGGSILLHGQGSDDGTLEPQVRQAWIAGPLASAGAELAWQRWGVGASAQIGAALDLSPAWVASDLRLRCDLSGGLYVAATLESSTRLASLTDAEGALVGTLQDRLNGGTVALGYAR